MANVLIRARTMLNIEHYQPLALSLLQKEGLTDDRLLIDIETRFIKYRNYIQQQEKSKQELSRPQGSKRQNKWESSAAAAMTLKSV